MTDAQVTQPETPVILQSGLRMSPKIGQLIAALCKAQLEFAPVVKANINPQFKSKYADLSTIISATMPSLAKHEVTVIQTPNTQGTDLIMTTMLAHSSGEWIANELTMPATMRESFTAQTIGSACTYSRRYALQAILGVAADLDDDGTEASGGGTREAAQSTGNAKLKEKLADKMKPGASLFYVFTTPDLATVMGDVELLKANKELLLSLGKKNGAKDEVLVSSENFDDLKFQLGERGVPFKKLEASSK